MSPPDRARLSAQKGGIIVLGLLASCAPIASSVTIDMAVRDVAPGYRVRAPANGTPDLGRRLLGGQPETNACFEGDKGTAVPSWSRMTLSYEDVLDGKLSIDFGGALKVSPSLSASSKRSASITLTDFLEERLSGVYMNASGSCTELFAEPGTSYVKVLTRAIKAKTIEVTADQATAAALQIDVTAIGGASTNASTASGRKLSGASLFFTDYPECLSVAYQKKECANVPVGPGRGCDLDTCSLQVTALGAANAGWAGKLSCEGGSASDLEGTMATWGKARKTAPGVVYNARVLPGTGVGTVTVDLRRWVTRSEPPEKCGH